METKTRTEVICWQIKDGKKKRGTNERTNEVDERRIRATAGLDGSQLSDVQSRAHNIIVALCCVVQGQL